jgi:hypothetical protein
MLIKLCTIFDCPLPPNILKFFCSIFCSHPVQFCCFTVKYSVQCYYVPDHNVSCCIKRPCISSSLDSLFPCLLRPLFITSPSIWLIFGHDVPVFYVPDWNVPGLLMMLCPCITTSLLTSYPRSVWPFVHLILNFCLELHQPMEWLDI